MGKKQRIMNGDNLLSHKLQPLDHIVYRLFKRYYNSAVNKSMRENQATTFFIHGMVELAKQAFELIFTTRNILSGFSTTEICPLNPDIFTNNDFATSVITDQLPLAFTTDLNLSHVELAEESLPGKGLDNLNNAHENVTSDYCPKIDPRELLETPFPANKVVGNCNSFATVSNMQRSLRDQNCMFVMWPISLLITFSLDQNPKKEKK